MFKPSMLDRSKMNDKLLTALVLTSIVLLLAPPIVWSAYWIYSNTAVVQVGEYTFSLSSPPSTPRYSNITLTAILIKDGVGVNGALVHFYLDVGAWTEIGQSLTDTSGTAMIDYNCTSQGALNFRGGYQVFP